MPSLLFPAASRLSSVWPRIDISRWPGRSAYHLTCSAVPRSSSLSCKPANNRHPAVLIRTRIQRIHLVCLSVYLGSITLHFFPIRTSNMVETIKGKKYPLLPTPIPSLQQRYRVRGPERRIFVTVLPPRYRSLPNQKS